ncbi:Metacaspase-9 [Thalictrum thalictroides]|uniref:Metacaspase-9 n=1 Tax=Thalictrum thalictroides TaxID=46969 RepID=A0A7J6XCJ4_THATH|nr:Metacaspase-9 [Thalictrum thalictroides]
MEKKKRMAILVGCNYPNTPNELHGCINDVLSMRDMLVNHFGFDLNHIEFLIDAPGSLVMPTGANIKKALNGMIDQAEPGDVLFFHYSGHGTRIPTNHGFKHDEAIVPCDLNLITDVDFRQLVNRLPDKSSFTIISDSCHSGGLIDNEKEQIGPSSMNLTLPISLNRPKNIPFHNILNDLTSHSGIQSSDICNHLLEIFGNEASAKFHQNKVQNMHIRSNIYSDSGILLSGCQANETSADMYPTMEGGKAYGAFSNAVQMIIKENGTSFTKKELIIKTSFTGTRL